MLLGDPVNQFIIENMENLSVKIVEEIKRKLNVSLDVTLVTVCILLIYVRSGVRSFILVWRRSIQKDDSYFC